MIRSSKSQLLNAEKEASNAYQIGKEIDQMIRNQMLMQGLTPPILFEEEKPGIEQERESIMALLKTITTQPNKFYTYLYNTNQISPFSIGMEEFARKYLKYKKNIPYNSLIKLWEAFKSGKSSEDVPVNLNEIINIGHVRERQRQNILNEEEKKRKNVESAEYQARRRRKENIEKKMQKLRSDIIRRTNDMIKEQDFKRQEIIQSEIDELNKEWKKYRTQLNKLAEDLPQKKFEKFEEWEEKHAIPFEEELSSGEGVRRMTGSGLKNHKKVKLLRINNNRVIYPIGHIWNWM